MLLKRAWLAVLMTVALGLAALPARAQWRSIGPWGGNARALAADPADPDHILLGSGAGALFESTDGGRHWQLLAQLGAGHELMVEILAFDPLQRQTIYAGGWNVSGQGGGFFLSRDGGRTWSQPPALAGKSVQAFAEEANAPGMLVAGSLDGVYRSLDWGGTWQRITPAGHPDLKNFESLAIDPSDPRVIYAGTWHLPWKTSDGGGHWQIIKQGVLDDSDVFSIILDAAHPQTVYASACSGIYKSDNGGALFRKVQGIPGSASRTRVLQQDPANPAVVYAGTTAGLWKTSDAGRSFRLISPPNYILNDVQIDPRHPARLLIATDRGGVFASDDGGESFYASNEGFSQRQVSALVAGDAPGELFASVLNDKEFGGVFAWQEQRWTQLNAGIEGLDVFDLERASSGELVAATSRGIFLLDPAARRWQPSQDVVQPGVPPRPAPGQAAPLALPLLHSSFTGRVRALDLGPHWLAATDGGVLRSQDRGHSWQGGPLDGEKDFVAVAARGDEAVAASVNALWRSHDGGQHWKRQPLPASITRIYSALLSSSGELFLATREGLLRWLPQQAIWEKVQRGLPAYEIGAIRESDRRLLAVPLGSDTLFVSSDQGQSWQAQPGVHVEVTSAAWRGLELVLATRHHGLFLRDKTTPPAASAAPSTRL